MMRILRPRKLTPINITVPVISGVAQVGNILYATPGTWTETPSIFHYQWHSDSAIINEAVTAKYMPIMKDVGKDLTVSVTAVKNNNRSISAMSFPTQAVTMSNNISSLIIISGLY